MSTDLEQLVRAHIAAAAAWRLLMDLQRVGAPEQIKKARDHWLATENELVGEFRRTQ